MPRMNSKEVVEEKVQGTVEQNTVKKTEKSYIVKVVGNPSYCGIGAGGVQFANGEARITSDRMAEWFREHDGYNVTEA